MTPHFIVRHDMEDPQEIAWQEEMEPCSSVPEHLSDGLSLPTCL